MNLSSLGWLSPARRAWPLVGLALLFAACENVEPEPGPEGPQGPGGDPGIGGPPGATGADGFATLIDAVTLDRGGECSYGGVRYDIGLDNGDNGGTARDSVLQPGEVDDSNTVCNASGAVADWAVPAGAPGSATISARGGDGTTTGGAGGMVQVMAVGSGGHVQAYATGTVDTSFSIVAATPQYGPEKLTITNGQNLTPTVVVYGAHGSVADNVVYTMSNIDGQFQFDDNLWIKHAGVPTQITGIEIQAGGTLTVPFDSFNSESIATFDFDIRNAGTITTPLNGQHRRPLVLAAHHYFGDASGTINLTGANGGGPTSGGEGGNLTLVLTTDTYEVSQNAALNNYGESSCPTSTGDGSGGFYNAGTIDISQGTVGTAQISLPSHYLNVCASDEIQNTGDLSARGQGGFSGQFIQLYGGEGGNSNSGTLDVRGGSGIGPTGTAGGGIIQVGAWVSTGGHIRGDGGSVSTTQNCDTGPCTGGKGGTYYVFSAGGPLSLTGQIDLRGGNAVGSGVGTMATAGNGGTLLAYSFNGYDGVLDAETPAGDILAMANVDIRGGNGGGTGGVGGQADLRISGGEGAYAFGQSVALMGYASIDVSGGDANATGGNGGNYRLLNGDGCWSFGAGCGSPIPTGATSGATINTVAVDLSGGNGGTLAGGVGGEFDAWAAWPYPMPTGEVVNRGAVDLGGGNGQTGGYGGEAWFVASGLLESSATVDVSGGDGNLSTGSGGGAGPIDFVSQHDQVGLHATLTSNGGAGRTGGSGGFTTLSGTEADIAGSVISAGGAGNVSSGSGGEGGAIDVWSSDTFSVVTGTLSSTGGAGFTTSGGGTIVVDGYVQQARGATP